MEMATAIQQLHDRCAIYTTASTASRLLDIIGWSANADLSKSILLEPCVGEGAILIEGARRLIASMRSNGRGLIKAALLPRIKGYEFHPAAARATKIQLRRLLIEAGIGWDSARELSERWVRECDFLLDKPRRATHIAANPPYVRWRKLPAMLANRYRKVRSKCHSRQSSADGACH